MKKEALEKIYKILAIAVVLLLLTSFIVTFVTIILPLFPKTRHRYKDYDTFRKKTNTSLITDIMPESAEPEYYFHSFVFKRQSGYRVQLSADDYDRLKKDAQERYLSHKEAMPLTGSLYIGAPNGTAALPDNPNFFKEDMKFINDKLIRSDEGFYLMYDFTIISSPRDYRVGMLCNDNTNEIIEFFISKGKAT